MNTSNESPRGKPRSSPPAGDNSFPEASPLQNKVTMADKQEKFFKHIRQIKLTPKEKEKGRAGLLAFMKHHPTKEKPKHRKNPGIMDSILWLLQRPLPVAMGMVAALLIGAAAYGAQTALPGDFLYGFKTKVSERLEAIPHVLADTREDFDIELANRRLLEATKVSTKNNVEPKVLAQVEKNIEVYSQKITNNVTNLAAQNKLAEAIEVSLEFEASLAAHQTVIEKANTEQVREQPSVAGKINEERTKLNETRKSIEEKLGTANADLRALAQNKLDAIKRKIDPEKGKEQALTTALENEDPLQKTVKEAEESLELDDKKALSLLQEADIKLKEGEIRKAIEEQGKTVKPSSGKEQDDKEKQKIEEAIPTNTSSSTVEIIPPKTEKEDQEGPLESVVKEEEVPEKLEDSMKENIPLLEE